MQVVDTTGQRAGGYDTEEEEDRVEERERWRGGTHKEKASMEEEIKAAKTMGRQMLIYSDGSKKHTAGSYAWIAGFEVNNSWKEIASGGGWERAEAGLTTKQTSTRLEALGILRAADWAEKNWEGEVTARLDNKAVITRFSNRKKSVNTQRRAEPDDDVWTEIRTHNLDKWKLEWVKGHADSKEEQEKRRKNPKEYPDLETHWIKLGPGKKKRVKITKHERRNIEVDRAADGHYGQAESEEQEYDGEEVGQIYYEKSPLKGRCANTLKQMIKESRTRKWIQKEMERHTAAHAMGEEEDICAKLDLQLLREMRNLAARKGKMTYYVKIMHRIIAMNVELVKRNQKDTDECECCGKQSETLTHILGHCDCEQIKEERGKMLRNVEIYNNKNTKRNESERTAKRSDHGNLEQQNNRTHAGGVATEGVQEENKQNGPHMGKGQGQSAKEMANGNNTGWSKEHVGRHIHNGIHQGTGSIRSKQR